MNISFESVLMPFAENYRNQSVLVENTACQNWSVLQTKDTTTTTTTSNDDDDDDTTVAVVCNHRHSTTGRKQNNTDCIYTCTLSTAYTACGLSAALMERPRGRQ